MSYIKLVFIVALLMFTLGGWVGNVYKLTQADFESPYKTEVIRAIGVIVPPMGAVIGWMDIGEEG